MNNWKIIPRKPKSLNKQQGFSLVEVLMASVILLLVTGAVFGVLISTTDFFETTSTDTQFFNNTQVAMERLRSELTSSYRNADLMAITDNSTQYQIQYNPGVGWNTSTNSPSFETTRGSFSRQITWVKATGLLTLDSGGNQQEILNSVTGFSLTTVSLQHFILSITLARGLSLGSGFETLERSYRHEMYILSDKS